jgi:hypothetical protein
VGELFSSVAPFVEGLDVAVRDKLKGVDGTYELDVRVRYRWAGLDFLVLVEVKQHKNPIKREVVQTVASKAASLGAHKAVVVATAPFQRGALEFARVHGVALMTLTEGRFTYEVRSAHAPPPLSRQEAEDAFGLPPIVGYCYQLHEGERLSSTLISPEFPKYVAELLLGVPVNGSQ